MKKLWLLIVVAIIVSCEPEKKVDYAIVSGKIANAKNLISIIFSKVIPTTTREVKNEIKARPVVIKNINLALSARLQDQNDASRINKRIEQGENIQRRHVEVQRFSAVTGFIEAQYYDMSMGIVAVHSGIKP